MIEFEITKQDCKLGDTLNPNMCAAAISLKRQFDNAIVGRTWSLVQKGNIAFRCKNTPITIQEILTFDRRHGFRPGRYFLTPFPPSGRIDYAKPNLNSKTDAKPKGIPWGMPLVLTPEQEKILPKKDRKKAPSAEEMNNVPIRIL